MKISKFFQASLVQICINKSLTNTTNVIEATKRTMQQTINLLHARYVLDLIHKLRKRNI